MLSSTDHFSDDEFSQLMKGLQKERVRQAFRYLDSDQDGFISPEEFKKIILVRRDAQGFLSTMLTTTLGSIWS